MKISKEKRKEIVKFIYKNWQGIVAFRTVIPDRIEFAESDWHPEKQWILVGYCLDRKAYRDFAIKDILDWTVKI